jgi:hypothetical protein
VSRRAASRQGRARLVALPGGGKALPAAVRAPYEQRLGHDFSGVRVHTDDASARALGARAYAVGRDVVVGSGALEPGLLAHELVHVVQQARGTDPAPGAYARAEREADARVADPGPAPGGPQADEDADARARRLQTAAAARNAVDHVAAALSGGYLWPFEAESPGGVTAEHTGEEETIDDRAARLRVLMDALRQLSTELEERPPPPEWWEESIDFPPKGSITAPGADTWEDTVHAYAHWARDRGDDMDRVWNDIAYIETEPVRKQVVKRKPVWRGINIGVWLVVEDPENRPLEYRKLDQYGGWNQKGKIVEVWVDDSGYFYMYDGVRHYLPERP